MRPEEGGEVWETCGRGLGTCGHGLETCEHGLETCEHDLETCGRGLVTCAGTMVGSDVGMCAGEGEGSGGEEVTCDGGRGRSAKAENLSSMSSDLEEQAEGLLSMGSDFVSSLILSSQGEGEGCHCPLD